MSDSLWPHESQHVRPPCPSQTPGISSNSCPSSRWCHPAISSSVVPSSPAPNPSQHQGLFQGVNSSHEVAKVLEFQLQHQSFQWTPRTDLLQYGLVGSPFSPRDSQESSPTPQFKSINSSVLRFLLEKEMATHSSVLAWRIPGMGEPGGLPSMGLHTVGHDWSDLAARAAAAFFTIYLSHSPVTTGKTIALTKMTSADKVMSLVSRLVITFLPRSRL